MNRSHPASFRIKTLFLSAQPCVYSAFMDFFLKDPFIKMKFENYSSFEKK